MNNKALEILEKYYGYKEFRKGQEEIIDNILKGRDSLAIMPTGGGKSICYQIPALILEGVTIVVSPLISLMKDQVDSLLEVGINATFINSTLSAKENLARISGIRNKEYKLIYVAPERLESYEFLEAITSNKISQIAIDEAHCVSQWGHDFRKSYKNICSFIEKMPLRPIITAFTATASELVKEDILKVLKLQNPKVFVTGFDRENLKIIIYKDKNKNKFISSYVKSQKNNSGIIYCSTRKDVDRVSAMLLKEGVEVASYHGGLSETERNKSQEDFIYDRVNVIVATNAFGMGIDKSNVRYVIHYSMPKTIEEYYQEIGRAGRDSEISETIMLFSPGDVQTQKYLIDISTEDPFRRDEQYKKLRQMTDLVHSKDCYRKYIINYFGDSYDKNCEFCSNCLDDGEEIDRTLDAQKVLSCIYRMKRNFGTTVIVDVLKGSKNKRIIELGFDKLSTYGIMKDSKKENIKEFINALISHGFIELKGNDYPIVALNNNSLEVLKGNIKVIFKEKKEIITIEEENQLLNELKELRSAIAIEKSLPPYVIFGDATLKEMAMKLPLTEMEFLSISGIGEKRFEQYGNQFKNIIENYVTENNIKKDNVDSNENIEGKVKDLPYEVVTDEKLLLELVELRKDFGKKENKLPQYIMPINCLKEISGRYPANEEQLKDINSLGPKKIERYGDRIIKIVLEYIEKNNLNVGWSKRGSRKLIINGESRSNEEIAIAELKNNKNIVDISIGLEVSLSTILGYVTNYIEERGELDFPLHLKPFLKDDERELILDSCKKLGYSNINLLKKDLPTNIKYENIRAVILDEFYLKHLKLEV